jgi:hypothetical protein
MNPDPYMVAVTEGGFERHTTCNITRYDPVVIALHTNTIGGVESSFIRPELGLSSYIS